MKRIRKMMSFGEITWRALAGANRARKIAGRHETEGDSDGLAICTVSRLCPPGVGVTGAAKRPTGEGGGNTVRDLTHRKANGEPPVTERGAASKTTPQGKGYMLAATLADGSERIGIGGPDSRGGGGAAEAVHVLTGRAHLGEMSAARLFYRYNSDRPGWNCVGCGLKYIALDGQRTTKPRLCVSCTEYVSA